MNLDVLKLLPITGEVVLAKAILAEPLFMTPLQSHDLGPVTFPFDWGTPDGADAVEVDPVSITVQADQGPDIPLGELPATVSGGELVVTVPNGRRIRALHLANLKVGDQTLRNESDLAGRRLSVSVPAPDGGWANPIVSAPAVYARGQVPATLTGASFANEVLRLPDIAGAKIRVSLVDGDTPDDFTAVTITAGTVTGWASTIAKDLALTLDGTTLWAYPGELGSAATGDVTVGVTTVLEKHRAAGEPVTGTLTLTAAHPSRVRLAVSDVTGAFLHRVPGITAVDLRGEPKNLPAMPAETPTSVTADLHVTYAGMRLAEISDALPPLGTQSGTVVRDAPVTRALPPLALRGERVTRVGLVGFCDPGTALLVRLVATDATPVGAPGVTSPQPGHTTGVVWVDLPEPVTVDVAVAIEVSAGAGRFFWVGDPQPLVRIVVLDPDPAGRPVVLGDVPLFTLPEPELHAVRVALPPAPFTGDTLVIASALFCTVEITDAELRYRRGA